LIVDVSAVFPKKLEAINAHSSQPVADWVEMATVLGRLHGVRVGCQFAEAFMEVPILGHRSACNFLPDMI
jgi:hypothetical protein